MISKDWLPRNYTESVVIDETHYIIVIIDFLEANNVTANDAFREFSKFYALHPGVFSQEVKQRMLDTAVEITKMLKGKNPFKSRHLIAMRDLLNPGKVIA